MAKTDTKTAPIANAADFDWSQFVPEGFDAADFEKTGGLAPIYAPKAAFESGFPPLVGFMIRTQLLPEIKQGKQTFIPEMILIEAAAPTKAVTGKNDTQEIVDVKKGDLVVVPITGNISTNEALLAAADDPDNVSLVGLRVTGQRKVNDMPSPMWVWDMMLNTKKVIPRKGSHLLLFTGNERPRLPSGEKYTKDGEVVREQPRMTA